MEPCIHWIGDSTVHFNRIDTWPQCGMGQVLELYLHPGVTVYDHAVNGRSTKSFWDEGRFEPIRQALKPGDFLFIQFGHNDEKDYDPTRYTTLEEFQSNLLRYARLAQAVGALPVLITPVTRRRFDGKTLIHSHGLYPQAARELAQREDLPLIDLTTASWEDVEHLGDQASRAYYMNFGPGLYPNYPDGDSDDTHLRYEGAVHFAGMVADGLGKLGGPYAQLLLENDANMEDDPFRGTEK